MSWTHWPKVTLAFGEFGKAERGSCVEEIQLAGSLQRPSATAGFQVKVEVSRMATEPTSLRTLHEALSQEHSARKA